jgi:hypothetical protein
MVNILHSEDMSSLLEVTLASDAASARTAVDTQQAQVAVIIPADFSHQFADLYGKATVEFYQDPTLTIGPSIVKSILNQFMDRISGIKIAVDLALDQSETVDYALIGEVIQQYLGSKTMQSKNLNEALLDVRPPVKAQTEENPIRRILGPIMGGMMIFYAFYTGTASAESILREEEERTLPRLFTTFGICANSFLKSTRQGGAVFGGVLTITGMGGMISIFAMSSPGRWIQERHHPRLGHRLGRAAGVRLDRLRGTILSSGGLAVLEQ